MSERRAVEPEILHQDESIVVVNKPAGVLSVPGRGGEPGLAEILRQRRLAPADADLRSVHRLDRDASGVIVLARTTDAERCLTEQFEQRRVEKVYLALATGYVAADGEVDLPLRTNADNTRATVDARDGKPSLTRYRIVERVAGHTLLEVHPETGRLHQIRVHLAAIGHPLAVDPLYGSGRPLLLSEMKPGYKPSGRHGERPLIDRLALHAVRLSFEHPDGRGVVTFEAPLPKDFRATLNQLRAISGSASARRGSR